MFLSRKQARTLDQNASEKVGVSSLILMENAGRAATDVLTQLGVSGKILICCGKGNNGGDGLVMARHLTIRKIATQILLFAKPDELSADAKAQWHIIKNLNIPFLIVVEQLNEVLMPQLQSADWVVDALFGTGFSGEMRSPFDRVIQLINTLAKKVISLDIPSGLDADTGQPSSSTIKAHHTVTFAAPKLGFASQEAAPFLGTVHVVDIGVPLTPIE